MKFRLDMKLQKDEHRMIDNKFPITEDDVIKAQSLWAENIINIGKLYIKKGNYKEYARNFVNKFYAYGTSKVLFKPTLASSKQFRNTFEDALSYFIGGEVIEDDGFALNCWDEIYYGERNIIIMEKHALAMGNYYFKSSKQNVIKVEFTFGYLKDVMGNLLINLHHSSLPYIKK